MAKYLITGAAGFIGSHLSERLIAEGHDVLGIDCLTDYYSRAQKMLNKNSVSDKGGEFLHLDLAKDDLTSALEGVDVIYHLAAQPGISATTPFDAYLKNNIIGTYRLLDAAKKSTSLRGFINIATSSIYGADATSDEKAEPKPTSYYGVTKLSAEQLVLAAAREEGFPASSMRLFSVYGPRERPEKLYPRLIASILEDKAFPLYAGSKKHLRSYTYVGDIIDGLVSLLDKLDEIKGEIFNLGTDIAITTGEGIRIVEEIIGKKAKIEPKPKRPGDQLTTHANITKARQVLGYNPTTTVQKGLEKEIKWYKEHIFGKIDLWQK